MASISRSTPPAVPLPRVPAACERGSRAEGPWARWYQWAHWYRDALGWTLAEEDDGSGGSGGVRPVLLTGVRFDVLELPADAGAALLRRAGPTGPVAVSEGRMRLLVAAGSAEEVPGLLDWLEWGGIALELTALGTGGRMTAPPPAGWSGSREAAVWLRPPVPGRGTEPALPALTPFGRGTGAGRGGGPDLVRLLDAAATECHRARLLRTNARPQATTDANAYECAACEYSAD
ncbi:SCO3374 family protein [Streptomyces jumonjinensis]|uniref:SCO3374 family protein n=1 Tax=Streptomyces jumonjinensis TaxID=1945 RepID=UPI0037B1012C